MRAYDPHREELVHLAGDPDTGGMTARGFEAAPDPWGTGKVGYQQTADLTSNALGHPKIRYRDLVIEADVYAMPGAPMHVHIICPRCRNALRIPADRKRIEYDPAAGAPTDGGRLSIETFECTWEAGAERGSGLCRWRVAVDDNVARDA